LESAHDNAVMRKWTLIPIVSGILLALGAFYAYQIVSKQVTSSEFRSFTEEKVGQFLRSSVKIGKIQFRFLKQISLSGLQIKQTNSQDPILIGVHRIVIRYNLWNFLSRQFKVPVSILLDSPKFLLKPGQPFWASILPSVIKRGDGLFRHVELDGGEVEVPVPLVDQKLKLTGIRGRSSWAGDQLRVDFLAKTDGFLEGDIDVKGTLKSGLQSGDLIILLKNINWRENTGIPVKNLQGEVELTGSTLVIRKISFDFKQIPCELSGTIENIFSPHPLYNLSWRFIEEGKEFSLQVKADLSDHSVSGNFSAFGRSHTFQGRIASGASAIRLEDLLLGNGYRAEGELNLKESRFHLSADHEEQRFSFDLSFKDFQIDLNLNMTHLKIAGHDVATLAKFKLRPVEKVWSGGQHHFDGTVESAYLIFNYQPLEDFSAAFRISPSGIESLSARWSRVSRLTGSVSFSHPVTSDLILQISKFDLSTLKRLGVHEIPAALGGELEGKIKISGLIREPAMEGQMSIQGGKVADFDYELATIHFNGQYPRINFKDSKITKKGKTYLLKGDVDFKLDNIVQNVKILSADQIVMWKGWNLKKEAENKNSSGSPSSDVLAGSRSYRIPRYSELELEYSLKKGKSLAVVAEDDKEGGQFVGAGPKMKF